MSRDQRQALAGSVSLHRPASRSSSVTELVVDRFSDVMGAGRAEPIEADAAVLVIADPPEDGRFILDAVRSLLPPVLHFAEEVRLAELQRANLDTALVCVAHELRGPLLASTTSIEGVLDRGGPDADADLDLLRWSHAELNELALTIDMLLKWTVAGQMPRRRQVRSGPYRARSREIGRS